LTKGPLIWVETNGKREGDKKERRKRKLGGKKGKEIWSARVIL